MRQGMRLVAVGIVVISSVLLWGPREALSQDHIELGPFRILLSLDLSGEYNDNILLAPTNEESDFIWTISPGITIELPGRTWALRLGYRADIVRYTDHSELDTTNHTVQAAAQGNFGRLNLSLIDEFKITQQFPGFPVPELTVVTERQENLLRVEADYRVADRWSVGAHYNFLLVNYTESQFNDLDHQEHTVGATLFYRLTPKLSLLGEYDYQIIRYDENGDARNSDSNFFLVGVKGDLTAKTSAGVKVGYQWKDYTSGENWDGPVVEAELIWKYREPSQLRLYIGRANVESTFQDNNFYVATYGGAELKHYITPVLLLTARGLIGTNDYPETVTVGTQTGKRDDTFYEFGVSLRYQIRRWLALELAYQFLQRDSNFSDFDYTNNLVIGTVHLTY